MRDEIPRIHIELEAIRSSIYHMFVMRNEELNDLVCDELEKTLSAEWVKESIRVEIEKIVKEAILNIKDDFSLRKVITDSISENLVKIFNKQNN